MPATSTATARPTSRPGVEPASAKATQTTTAATGDTHRTGTTHQSIFDGYHRSCSADMGTPVVVDAVGSRCRPQVPAQALAPSHLSPAGCAALASGHVLAGLCGGG